MEKEKTWAERQTVGFCQGASCPPLLGQRTCVGARSAEPSSCHLSQALGLFPDLRLSPNMEHVFGRPYPTPTKCIYLEVLPDLPSPLS